MLCSVKHRNDALGWWARLCYALCYHLIGGPSGNGDGEQGNIPVPAKPDRECFSHISIPVENKMIPNLSLNR